jgi:hypothetical protein
LPNNTAIFNLPYPAATDAPCDFDEQWCDFTDAIDNVFATFQAGIDRAYPTIPIAMVQQTTPRSILNLENHPFDTVAIDTAGMTDIDADPFHVTIPRPGVYTVAAGMIFPSPALVLNGFLSLQVTQDVFSGFSVDVQAEALDRGAGVDYHITGYAPARFLPQGLKLGVTHNFGNQSVKTITSTWLSVSWHADTMVPA